MKLSYAAVCVIWAAAVSAAVGESAATAPARTVGQAMEKAGANRAQLEKALAGVSGVQREGMEFLIANMPDRDLTSLSGEFLVENVSVAYEAFAKSPWAGQVSKELFLNDVLPYVNLNERRDNWRKDFAARFAPLVKDCRTISQAAAVLNGKIFVELKVRYSTDRPKPDQSPYESTAVGKASCTGLAILLVDACRAVGIPARVAGAPAWADGSGNHTWVEVWDGRWHFTGRPSRRAKNSTTRGLSPGPGRPRKTTRCTPCSPRAAATASASTWWHWPRPRLTPVWSTSILARRSLPGWPPAPIAARFSFSLGDL